MYHDGFVFVCISLGEVRTVYATPNLLYGILYYTFQVHLIYTPILVLNLLSVWLGLKSRNLQMLGKCSTNELHL